jgi:hypothetical protein
MHHEHFRKIRIFGAVFYIAQPYCFRFEEAQCAESPAGTAAVLVFHTGYRVGLDGSEFVVGKIDFTSLSVQAKG